MWQYIFTSILVALPLYRRPTRGDLLISVLIQAAKINVRADAGDSTGGSQCCRKLQLTITIAQKIQITLSCPYSFEIMVFRGTVACILVVPLGFNFGLVLMLVSQQWEEKT